MTTTIKDGGFEGQYLLMKYKEISNLLSEKYPELLDDANEHLQGLLLEIWRGKKPILTPGGIQQLQCLTEEELDIAPTAVLNKPTATPTIIKGEPKQKEAAKASALDEPHETDRLRRF